jgi:putative phage-type endonuclease
VSTASLPTADRAAWLAARRTGIGASEVAAVLGLSPYESPLDVYCHKLGLVPEKAETEAMRWGLRLEPLLAAEYAERTGWPLVATQVFLRHPDKPFLLATLDGVRADGRPVELKTVGLRRAAELGVDGDDGLPTAWQCQLHAQMLTSGQPVADLAALIGGQEFRLYTVEADPRLLTLIEDRLTEFWGHVERREPPPAERPSDARLMPSLFPDPAGVVACDEHVQHMVEEYERLGPEIRTAEQQRDRLKAGILQALGDAEFGGLPDGRMLRRKVIEVGEKVVTRQAYRYVDLRVKGR